MLVLLLIIMASCQTTVIKDKKYKVSKSTIELGSIGRAKYMFNIDNKFSIHSIPVLHNNVRLDVQILPFNKDINTIYKSKAALNPSAIKVEYVDSLPTKPHYITVSIMDRTGFANELNNEYNQDITTYLKDAKNAVIVTGMALVLPAEDISKIKLADTYYLVNSQDKKHSITLYKAGKKTDTIELHDGLPLAYTLGKFCWAISDRQQWYISEVVDDNKGCKGNTNRHIKDKEEKNLFKL